MYPKNRKSSKIEVRQIVVSSPNSNRTQTLVAFFFVIADFFYFSFILLIRSIISFTDQGPVVRRPISANPGLNFNLGFFIPLLKGLFGIIFSVLFKASNIHTLD